MSKEKKKVEFDKVALGLIKKDEMFHIVEIPYNSKTFEAGEGKIIQSTDRIDSEDRFKIHVVNRVFNKVEGSGA